MTGGRKTLVWLVCIIVALYGVFVAAFPTTTINYRLTLEAMTPDGPTTGSGVIQVSYSSNINVNGGGRKGSVSVNGEAVYLDLGRDKNLFVTLTTAGSARDSATGVQWLPQKAFGFTWDWGDERELARQARAAKAAGPKGIPLIALPTMVTFRDLTDPMSVELINPQDIFSKFGSGYALTKATLELTDNQPTEEIDKTLNWVDRINGGYLHGGFTSRGSPYGLSGLAFKSKGFSP